MAELNKNYLMTESRKLEDVSACSIISPVISLLLYILDIISDILVAEMLHSEGYLDIFALSLALIAIPLVITNVISAKWYCEDNVSFRGLLMPLTETDMIIRCILHVTGLGAVACYLDSILYGLKAIQQSKKLWLAMTVWIVLFRPYFHDYDFEFWKQLFVSIVLGFVNQFCFLTFKEGSTLCTQLAFYLIINLENITFFVLWDSYTLETVWYRAPAFASIFIGSMLGITFKLMYYGACHPSFRCVRLVRSEDDIPPAVKNVLVLCRTCPYKILIHDQRLKENTIELLENSSDCRSTWMTTVQTR